MKKILESVFVSCGLVLLVLLSLITALGEKESYSYYENRNLAEKPLWETDAVLDGTYGAELESYLTDHAAGRETLNRICTAIDLKILHRPVVNDIVIDENILLPFLDYEVLDTEVIHQQANALADNLDVVSGAVSSYGGVYCYVAIPGQYSYFEDRYPTYMNNRSAYMDAAVSTLSTVLDARNISFLDLGPMYAELGYPTELSSAVDNHYSAQGAHLAYEAILQYLNETHGANFPVLTASDLTFTPVDRHYLGARSRKIFDLTDIEETLYTISPNTPVSPLRIDNGYAAASSVYELPESPSDPITYSYYMGGDIALTELHTYRDALPTVLLYGDSYTNAMESILYLSCESLYAIDLRHYSDSTLTDFILETQPDYVIGLRDYGVLLSTDGNGGT